MFGMSRGKKPKSVRELGVYGIWRDRDDIGTGIEYVSCIRQVLARGLTEVKHSWSTWWIRDILSIRSALGSYNPPVSFDHFCGDQIFKSLKTRRLLR
jgi:hypothetical protein